MTPSPLSFIAEYDFCIRCPKCLAGSLANGKDQGVVCLDCGQGFPVEDNIPLLFWPRDSLEAPEDAAKRMRAFYEESPFTGYDELEDVSSLLNKGRRDGFARALNDELPYGIGVLEVGCGNGPLGAFLSIANRTVFSVDTTVNSLKPGQAFKEKQGLNRLNFMQMNLFRPAFRESSFHVLICNGVLHHTADPEGGFKSLSRLVMPGGYIIVGLYHKYGRLVADLRRVLFNITGGRFSFLDHRVENRKPGDETGKARSMDQCKNPHESKHTFEEVLGWFEEEGFDFINSIPKTVPGRLYDSATEKLFEPDSPGTRAERFLAEITTPLFQKDKSGIFIMIGKKRE